MRPGFRAQRLAAAVSLAVVLAGCLSNRSAEPPTGSSTSPSGPAAAAPSAVPPSAVPPVAPSTSNAALADVRSRREDAAATVGKVLEGSPSRAAPERSSMSVITPKVDRHVVQVAPMPPGSVMVVPTPESREQYGEIRENGVMRVAEAPVSTFSIDVDTGSWSNVRRMLNAGRLPPTDAVRVEELINYFPYDDARPTDGAPFAVHTQVAAAPWNPQKLVMRIGIKAEDRSIEALPPANLVFLVDVSGSMNSPDKLPLLKSSLKLLVERMRPQDRISLVTYASGTSVPLEAVPGSEKSRILNAIDGLRASGSTAGASGIEAAYRVARQGFIQQGINRILLATDGDFNVGVTDFRQLKDLVAERRASGISLSTLGFGTGNINERLMEQLADVGDGAYSYIDTLMEGQKVLVTEMSSTLATVAKDVKIQVEFNPATVAEYRLIGYENRMLAREDFNNDKVDAGDVGAGHSVTALYELTPTGARTAIDPLRYGAVGQGPTTRPAASENREFAFVRLRYKSPTAGTPEAPSRLIERPVPAKVATLSATDADFRFATAVAGFGQVLRGGRHTGTWTIADARALAAGAVGPDRFGYRAEALRLMDLAGVLATRSAQAPSTGEPVRN